MQKAGRVEMERGERLLFMSMPDGRCAEEIPSSLSTGYEVIQTTFVQNVMLPCGRHDLNIMAV
jgi:hypothetical protein